MMNSKIVFFGYVSFLREKVDAAIEIMSRRRSDYLYKCFNPTRIVQDGPMEGDPNLSFSMVLETEDIYDIVSDIQLVVNELPFLSCTLIVEDLSTREHFVHKWENTDSSPVS